MCHCDVGHRHIQAPSPRPPNVGISELLRTDPVSLRAMSAVGMTWTMPACRQCQPPQPPGRISLGEPGSQGLRNHARESEKRRTYIDCAAGAGINSWSRRGVRTLRAAASKAPVLKAVEIHCKCAGWITWKYFCLE